MPALIALFRRVLAASERVQVELQGQYSMTRLHELVHHVQTASLLYDIAVVVATPVPCILLVALTDVARLSPPEGGIYNQTLAFWMRVAVAVLIFSVAAVHQFHQSSAALHITRLQLWTISLFLTVALTFLTFVYAIMIGFPVPFGVQILTPWWELLLALSLWTLWKRQLRDDQDARLGLQRYAWHFANVAVMAIVYPLLRYLFDTLHSHGQLVIMMVLPFVKLGFRNWSNYGVYRMEDLAPVVVTFNVDVFHALFLSCVMRGANSRTTLLMTMAVDITLGCVNVYEVHQVLEQVTRVADEIQSLETVNDKALVRVLPVGHHNLIQEAVASITSHRHVIEASPSIARARHLRVAKPHARSRVSPFRATQVATVSHGTGIQVAEPIGATRPTPCDHLRARHVQHILRLLHMVEFYMLIEFAEVMVVFIYSAYLAMMSRLPNRKYYDQIKTMTDDQLQGTLRKVLTYAGLELLSFLVLTFLLTKMLGFPAFRILAFALQKHWLMVQSQLAFSVYYVIHLSLQHFGNDFTFQFQWLHGR